MYFIIVCGIKLKKINKKLIKKKKQKFFNRTKKVSRWKWIQMEKVSTILGYHYGSGANAKTICHGANERSKVDISWWLQNDTIVIM